MKLFTSTLAGALLAGLGVHAEADSLRITLHNDAAVGGNYLTPLWVGLHDGGFDLFDTGSAASSALESLAEDGNPAGLNAAFAGHGVAGVLGAGPLAPGASASLMLDAATDGSHAFLSFASMVLPTSDFFIGNDDPRAVALGGLLDGSFGRITLSITRVYDAGTEVNDFATSAGNGLFGIPGGQAGPNQGANQGGVVSIAQGGDFALFLNVDGIDVTPLNFSALPALATLTIERVAPVPLPAGLPLLAGGLATLLATRRRRKG